MPQFLGLLGNTDSGKILNNMRNISVQLVRFLLCITFVKAIKQEFKQPNCMFSHPPPLANTWPLHTTDWA